MPKKQKKRELSTAALFFITVLISLVILGIIAFFFLNRLVFNKVPSEAQTAIEPTISPKEEDSCTILILGTDSGSLKQCELLYFDSMNSTFMFVPIPLEAKCQVNTKKGILVDFFNAKDIKQICYAVENMYDIPIEKYIEISPPSFNVLINTLGKISSPPLCDINYTNPKNNEIFSFKKDEKTLFNSNKLLQLINYPEYPNEKKDNLYVLGSISSSITNTFLNSDKDILSCLDVLYKDVISTANTSISEYDFYSKRNSILYLLKNTSNPSFFVLPEWNNNNNDSLVLSAEHTNIVKNYILQ